MKIGLFDSGIGGLNVLKELKEKYPNNDYIYYGDFLNLPYGSKNKEELLELSKKAIDFLIDKEAKLIIIACGTVSSNCIKELSKMYSKKVEILDIISPSIDYLNKSIYENIMVIATDKTIESSIFKKSINKDKTVYEISTPELVPIIELEENNYQREVKIKNLLKFYLNDYKFDSIVLGCTHYPYIIKEIKALYPTIKIIDMGETISNKKHKDAGNKTIELYFTKLNNQLLKNINEIVKYSYCIEEVI